MHEVQYLGQQVAPSVLIVSGESQVQALFFRVIKESKHLKHLDPSTLPEQSLQPVAQFLQIP